MENIHPKSPKKFEKYVSKINPTCEEKLWKIVEKWGKFWKKNMNQKCRTLFKNSEKILKNGWK